MTALAEELRTAPESRVTSRESREAASDQLPGASDQLPAASFQTPLPRPAVGAQSAHRRFGRLPPGRRAWWKYAVAAGVLLVAGMLLARQFLSVRPSVRQSVSDQPIVAVLPLQNATGDSTFNLAGAMVTDWVTQSLAQTGLVRVLDTRSLLTETGDVQELARRSKVSYLVTGRIFRQGDSLRFTAQLTDARSGEIVNTIREVMSPASEPTAALKMLEQRVTGALAVQVDPS